MRARTVHSALGWIPGEGPTHDEDDPLALRPADRRRVLDGESRAAGHAAARRRRADRTSCWSATPTSSRRSAPASRSRSSSPPGSSRPPRLTHIFRQAAGSMIVQGAHAIRRGEAPDFTAGEGMRRDLFLIERADPRAGAGGDRLARRRAAARALRHRPGPRHPGVRARVPGRARDRRAQRGAARGAQPRRPSRCAAAGCGSATS